MAVTSTVDAEDWSAFRGAWGNGVSDVKDVPLKWSANDNVVWKKPLPAPGNGSPVISQGKVFVTCAEDEGRKRSLYCFDLASGKELWVRDINFDRVMPTHKTNPYGGTTPAVADGKVVVWHSSAGLYCYDVDGNELWNRQFGDFRHMWGYGTSPVVHQQRVILHSGPGEKVFVAALNLNTGDTIWRQDEPVEGNGERNDKNQYMGSWCTPVIANTTAGEVLVCSMSTRVNGYDPESGEIVFSCGGLRGKKGDLAYASPVISGQLCVAMGGFNGPTLAFEMSGRGDITENSRLWRKEPNPQRIGSGVFADGFLFMANAGPNAIECIDVDSGDSLWRKRVDGAHWGSIVSVGGNLFATDQNGTTTVFRPNSKKFDLVATNRLKEQTNSTPAIAEGRFVIRTFKHLYAVGK
jgi:outer membrane protein assembly factor BamB